MKVVVVFSESVVSRPTMRTICATICFLTLFSDCGQHHGPASRIAESLGTQSFAPGYRLYEFLITSNTSVDKLDSSSIFQLAATSKIESSYDARLPLVFARIHELTIGFAECFARTVHD